MKANSRADFTKFNFPQLRKIDRLDSLRGSTSETYSEETFGPLSNVRFAVFSLGSSAYPNFCAFGKYVDNVLAELGGERLIRIAYGDEMCGQEHTFRLWAPEVFKVACDTFCLDTDDTLSTASLVLQGDSMTIDTVRLVSVKDGGTLETQLGKYHNKSILVGKVKREPQSLHRESSAQGRSTIAIEFIATDVKYQPGDHVGIFPSNREDIVNGILTRLSGSEDFDRLLQLQLLKENHSTNGKNRKLSTKFVREISIIYLFVRQECRKVGNRMKNCQHVRCARCSRGSSTSPRRQQDSS